MSIQHTADSDRTDASFHMPLLDLASEPDDQGRQPEGVRFLAKMEGIGGSALFALGGALTGTAAAIPLGGWLPSYICAVAVLYGLAALLVAGRYGLLAGKPWARKLAVGLAVYHITFGIALLLYPIMSPVARRLGGKKFLTAAIVIGLIIAVGGGVVLWYLYRPHINRYFDGAHQPSAQRVGQNMWVCRFFASMLDEFLAILGELDYNIPNWNMLNGLRTAHDALARPL